MPNSQLSGSLTHTLGTWYFTCNQKGLTGVSRHPYEGIDEANHDPLVVQHARGLLAMLDGKIHRYPYPMVISGTEFQKKVWRSIVAIPTGQTKSYAQIAAEIDSPAVRAVGTACGANQLPLAIPCHRVIRSDGSLGGFAFGLELKAALLSAEREHIQLNKPHQIAA